jgi:pimeloyl-ACP methyl ester carboxylesterase
MPILHRRRAGFVMGAVAAIVLVTSPAAWAVKGGAHVYLLRGIFNVSVGLDDFAAKLEKLGIPASVYGHTDADEVVAAATRDYRSGELRTIVLIGHSLGAGAAMAVAHELDAAGVPVSLLISLDPVFQNTVAANVRRAVNYYVPGTGVVVGREAGFRGDLKNIDVGNEPDMGHMAVQAAEPMHKRMIDTVRAAIRGEGPPDKRNAPALLKHAGARTHP